MHGILTITEIRDNEPRKEMRGIIMIIILDRYIVEIIDSSKYKLHLFIRITRDIRDLLQVERKHDMRDLYYISSSLYSCTYILI